jgi:hypothetical protein
LNTQQKDRVPALLVRRCGESWNWAVVEADGTVGAQGEAPNQDAAMSAAWTTSRAKAEPGGWDYPNIIVGRE